MGENTCDRCSKQVKNTWNFCPYCGSILNTLSNVSLSQLPITLFDNIFIIDLKGILLYCSQGILDMLNCGTEKVGQIHLFDLIYSYDVPIVRELFEQLGSYQKKELCFETRFVGKQALIWVSIHMILVNDQLEQPKIIAVCSDISKQKAAEKEIETQNAIINLLYDTSLSIINRLDVNDLLITILKRAATIVGTSHGYIYHYHPETDTMEMEIGIGAYADSRVVNLKANKGGIGGKVWKTGQPIIVEDYSIWSENLPDLPFYPRSVIAIPLKSKDKVISILTLATLDEGQVFGQVEVERLLQFGQLASIALNNAILFTELKQEIIDRKKAEEALYKSTQQLRAIMESAKDFIYIKDNESIVREANPAMYNSLGFKKEEIIGKRFCELFGEVFRYSMELDQAVLAGQTVEEEIVLEINNREFVFDKLETPLRERDDKIIGISGIMRDITERKKSEREMLEAKEIIARTEKLAALGVMAGGISHEINQPLNSIKVNATGLLYRYKNSMPITVEEVMEEVYEISTQVDRIDNIVKHMRAIIRDQNDTNLVPCNLNEIIEHALDLVNSQINAHGITVTKVLASDLPLILATETGLEEVVINLVMNAIQALDEVIDRKKEIIIISKAENSVQLEICDNGPGVSDEVKPMIFDPFFTTKQNQRNMGVGLSISQSIINSYQGHIDIYSNEQQGTCLRLRFPIYG